jgi:hypothetical protein
VGDWTAGLQVVDVSNPASPALLGSYATSGNTWGVAALGTTVYVADGPSGLLVLDAGNPTSPVPLGSYNTTGWSRGVALSGTAVYVADEQSGLEIFNAGNPSSATLLGSYDTPGNAVSVAVSGGVAYVADGVSGLEIFNVSNPASPTLIWNYDTPDFASAVAVSGTVAYVADQASGLQIINVSNPAGPTLIGSYNTPGFAQSVSVSGTVAYVADEAGGGLQIIDVSNPASPTLLGSYDTPGQAQGIAVSGTVAYVADWLSGLQILNVSNPASPTLLGSYDTPGNARSVAVSGTVACVADFGSGLQLFDVGNPATPKLIGSYDTPGNAYNLVVSGAVAYVADGNSGLQILEVMQNRFDRARNIGRSLELDAAPDAIKKVRLTTTQVSNATWDVSANGGANWQAATPGGGWLSLATAGADLRWRAELAPVPPIATATNPEASRVELEWLYDFPVLEAIADIGNDQGRQVRLNWMRSANDFVGAVPQIMSYSIYRRVDPGAAPLAALAAANPGGPEALVSGWDFVTSVPADADDEYAVVVPTLADSTVANGQHWSAFRVRALTATPGVFYDSYPDSGYSKDNLVPAAPAALAVIYEQGSGNVLTWTNPADEDFSHINIYRANVAGFTPGPSNLVHTTNATTWTDAAPGAAYYKVTAVDESGNESNAATASQTVGVEGAATPIAFALHAAVPNPFAHSTSFAYDVPASGGAVKLGVYDISGRMVRALVDGPQSAGRKTMTWDGRDDQGRALPVGLYMMRMQAAGFAQMRKLVLTK